LFGNEGARNDSQREGPQPAGKLTSIQDLTMLEQVDNTDAGNVAIFGSSPQVMCVTYLSASSGLFGLITVGS